MKTTKSKIWSTVLASLFFLLFYAPLISLVVFSFNDRKSVTSWGGFSLKWYKNLFTNTQIIEIVITTLVIAFVATFVSIVLGTLASIGLSKTNKKARNLILQANNLPITNPDIVTAIGLLLIFVSLGIERGYGTMLLAHISFCTPYVIVTVYPKIKSLDPNLLEAAMDLGAKPNKAIRSVILPQIKTSIFAAAAISFTMSFDDFVISYFTGGKSMNISTYLYTTAKKLNPTFNALSTIIILIIVLKIVIDKVRQSKIVTEDEIDTKPRSGVTKKLALLLLVCVAVISPLWLRRYNKETLYIFNAGEYIDNDPVDGVDLISTFESEYNCRVVYNTFESNEAALSKLETESYDIVIPSDYAIEQLISEDRIAEIDWSRLNVSKEDVALPLLNILNDLKAQEGGYDLLKYGVPYFFGSVGIVYNKANVTIEELESEGWGIFKDRKYRNKVAFYDSSRDGFMVALKDLGYSMNTSDSAELEEAYNWLREMKSNVNPSFKTDELLDEMPNGTWDLTFMYSGDATYAIMLAEENDIELGYYIPESGSNIFCDAMVIPSDAGNVDLAYDFINFMTDSENAYANSEYVCYTSANEDAYNMAIDEEGSFNSYLESYIVNVNINDEIFRYNHAVKEITSDRWSKLKTD